MARTTVALLMLSLAAAAQETVRETDPSGRYSIEVPKAWGLEVYEQDGERDLALRGDVPDLGYVWIAVYLLDGSRDPLHQAWLEHDTRLLENGVTSAEVEPGPPPRLVYRHTVLGEKRVDALAYFMVRRHGVSVRFTCSEDAWPRMKGLYAGIAGTLRLEVEEWPPAPPGYERTVTDDHVWYVQPEVDAAAVRGLRSHCRSVERRFEKVHGKLRIDPDTPPVVVVCRSRTEVQALYEGAKGDRYGATLDRQGGRVFLTPLPKEAGPEHADAAECYWRLLLIQKYGAAWPHWMADGEGEAAWAEERTGKRLPNVHKELWEKLPVDPVPFAKLLEMEAASVWADPFTGNACAYVLFFRAGPSKYRKAYRDFCEDFAKTKDSKGAIQRRLGVLDQERMREDLHRWLAKVQAARKE